MWENVLPQLVPTHSGDTIDFLSWLFNMLHKALCGGKKSSDSEPSGGGEGPSGGGEGAQWRGRGDPVEGGEGAQWRGERGPAPCYFVT